MAEENIIEEYIIANSDKLNLEYLLRHYQFSEETLRKLIYKINLITIFKTQKISTQFINEIILNENYHIESDEKYITLEDVLYFQKNIGKKESLSKNKFFL